MTIGSETAGVTPAGEGLCGVVWDILGQTYKPLQVSAASFAFDTLFPPGTFVPPHIHPEQDEYIRVLEGRFDLWLDGAESSAVAGDLVRLPRGGAHGIFNLPERRPHPQRPACRAAIRMTEERQTG
jgi:hypothetical protein